MLQAIVDAWKAITARIRGAAKAEDDAKHAENRKAAEAEVERRKNEGKS